MPGTLRNKWEFLPMLVVLHTMFTCDNNLALEHVLRGGNSDFSLEVMFKKLRKASLKN